MSPVEPGARPVESGARPARHGFAGDLAKALAATADPDLAARQLQRLAERDGGGGLAGGVSPGGEALSAGGPAGDVPTGNAAAGDVMTAMARDKRFRDRLLAVLGASVALGDHLVASPGEWRALMPEGQAPASAGANPPGRQAGGSADGQACRSAGGPDRPAAEPGNGQDSGLAGASDVAALRMAYRRELTVIAADDLTGACPLEEVMARLSALADATVAAAFRMAGGGPQTALAVIAMGKCGGQELNYVSDVDVVFVCAEDADVAPTTVVAIRLMQICAQVAWPVDAALRPEGSQGPLVRTLAGHLAYYRKWARTWEFQALLKARPCAGDLALGQRWRDALGELIWHAAERPEAVGDIRAMRRRIIDSVPRNEVDREIKRGPGGLRDVEFAVQLLQLVHGRVDETLRTPSTLAALAALIAGGYVGRADGEALLAAYRFLRLVEHRLQMRRLRRTHTVPTDPAALRALALALGYTPQGDRDPRERFRADWVAHAAEVRRLHAKLLYRPLLEAVARVPSDQLRLHPDAARARLEVLGFADPAGALRHIQALSSGVSRNAAIQRTLLPVLLSEFADEPEPDRGLLAYRQVSEALGATPWYLRLLRDEGPVALRLAELLGRSRYMTDLLIRDPEALRLLADDRELAPRPHATLVDGAVAAAARHGDPVAGAAAVRALRRRELFRVACADLLGLADLDQVGVGVSDITDAALAGVLDAAMRDVGAAGSRTGAEGRAARIEGQAAREGAPGLRFAIIGMGRLGGQEMSYASDADVLFVYEPAPGAAEDAASGVAHTIAGTIRRVLTTPAPDPPLPVDADLRPEGRQGPLVRSLAAYRLYYARWSKTWEAQALLRARFVAGDEDLGARFLALADEWRYPAGGLSQEQITEVRRVKARVDSERMPRGADPATHAKLGRGGLADVEWAVQLLQLRHGHATPGLRTTRTLGALAAAHAAGLVEAADAVALSSAWRLAGRVRNALTLVRGRPSDQLPRHGVELAGVVRVLGAGDAGEFVDEYLRTARRARASFERIFHD